MLSSADLLNLSLDFSRQAGIGQTLTLTVNDGGRTETATGSAATQPVIVSLSAAAKASLAKQAAGASGDEIALALFGAKSPTPAWRSISKAVPTNTDPSSDAASTEVTFETKLAQAQQMSPSERFYAMTDETQADVLARALSPDERDAFLASFKAKTLTIQDSSDVPGLNFSETTTATGGANGVGGTTTCSYDSAVARQQNPGGCLLFATPVLGCSVITWPSSKAASSGPNTQATTALD